MINLTWIYIKSNNVRFDQSVFLYVFLCGICFRIYNIYLTGSNSLLSILTYDLHVDL